MFLSQIHIFLRLNTAFGGVGDPPTTVEWPVSACFSLTLVLGGWFAGLAPLWVGMSDSLVLLPALPLI